MVHLHDVSFEFCARVCVCVCVLILPFHHNIMWRVSTCAWSVKSCVRELLILARFPAKKTLPAFKLCCLRRRRAPSCAHPRRGCTAWCWDAWHRDLFSWHRLWHRHWLRLLLLCLLLRLASDVLRHWHRLLLLGLCLQPLLSLQLLDQAVRLVADSHVPKPIIQEVLYVKYRKCA